MGNLCAAPDAEAKASKDIDGQLKNSVNVDSLVVKLLLLGAGESGKSTVFKQLKILHNHGFSDSELAEVRAAVHNNTLQNMRNLLDAINKLGLHLPEEAKAAASHVIEAKYNDPVTPALAVDIKVLWENSVVQEAYSRRNEFQLPDSAAYFFGNVDRVAAADYKPTEADALRCRVRTSGIVEMSFETDGCAFKMFDVGGQRNERRKWIHCFDNVHAVLFVAAISEYDQVLYEDDRQNRIREALSLFGEICNSMYFEETSMILFLNKRDLFEEKIQRVDLKVCFPEYEGGLNYDLGVEFLKQKFEELKNNPEKQIYTHITCATDTGNIQFVFNAVKDTVLAQNLKGSGFM